MTTHYGPSHSIAMLLDQAARYMAELPDPTPRPELPEFAFSPKGECNPAKRITGQHTCTDECARPTALAALQPLVSVRAPHTPGKADPIWDTAFKAKISKPAEPKFVQPKGYTGPVDEALRGCEDRAAEINAIARTQHLELSPISAQLAANGFNVARIQGVEQDEDTFNYVTDFVTTAYEPDPLTIAATSRLIEWERFKLGCTDHSRTRWIVDGKGELGIQYLGYRWDDKEYALAQKRKFKYDWIDQHGRMPTVEEVLDNENFIAYYGGRTAIAHMSDEEFAAFLRWKQDGDDDPLDSARVQWLNEGLERTDARGYAGPAGLLYMDDDGQPYWTDGDDDQSMEPNIEDAE